MIVYYRYTLVGTVSSFLSSCIKATELTICDLDLACMQLLQVRACMHFLFTVYIHVRKIVV